jgi:hypothetical protein
MLAGVHTSRGLKKIGAVRVNEVRLPPTLVPRHLPRLDAETLGRAAITHAALQAGVEVERPTPVKPRIVSSAHGALRHLLLCYPSYAGGDDVYREVFLDLFRQLPSSVELTVLAHASVVGDLQQSVEAVRQVAATTIVEAPEYLNYTVWAEDPYVVVDDVASEPLRKFLVEPFTFPRAGDSIVAELVAEASELQSIQSPLFFQGGNILIADDRVLIGVDYLYETLETLARYQPVLGMPDDRAQGPGVRRGVVPKDLRSRAGLLLRRDAVAGPGRRVTTGDDRRRAVDGGALRRYRIPPTDLPHRHVRQPHRARTVGAIGYSSAHRLRQIACWAGSRCPTP